MEEEEKKTFDFFRSSRVRRQDLCVGLFVFQADIDR